MHRVHPLWRGFWLACLWTAALYLLDGPDWLAPYRTERAALAFALSCAAASLLLSLPALVRKRSVPSRPRWTQLMISFLSGLAMVLACGMASTGRILPALLEGSVGAYAFLGAAALSGLITARLLGRRGRA